MIPWTRISSYQGFIRSKWTWLLLGLCLVTFLVIVKWPKEAKKESIKTEKVEEPKDEVVAEVSVPQEVVEEEQGPQESPPDEAKEAELDVVKTLQGTVTISDPCMQGLTIGGFDFDTGPVDVSGIRDGDVVKAHYIEKKLGWRKINVLKSLELIAASQQSTAERIMPQRKESPRRAAAQQEEAEDAMLKEEEPRYTTMEGHVTALGDCLPVIEVEGLEFYMGNGNVSGVQAGDYVQITYIGNVLHSIKVIERNH
jgi:hypothetical protein